MRLFAVAATLLVILVLLLHGSPFSPAVSYTVTWIGASILFLLAAARVFTLQLSVRTVSVLLAVSLFLRLSFLTTAPIGSDDVYRYMWDGKVQAAGINPYRFAPDAEELRELHTTLLPSAVNHPSMKTVYFPLSQWVFFLCFQISGENIWAYKFFGLVSEALTLLGLSLLLRRLGVPLQFILLYALCPLPIVQFAIDAHLDGLGLPLLLFSLLFYLNEKRVISYLLLGLSMSIKPVALVAIPALVLHEKGTAGKVRAVLLPLLPVAVQFIPYLSGTNPFEALSTFTMHWMFNGAVFNLLHLSIADNQKTRLLCGLLLAVALLLLSLTKKNLLQKIYDAFLLLLLFSPVVHPWYVTWLAVLLPAVRRWSGLVFASAVSLTSFTILTYTQSGVWEEYPLILIAEYLPVVILFLYELRKRAETLKPV